MIFAVTTHGPTNPNGSKICAISDNTSIVRFDMRDFEHASTEDGNQFNEEGKTAIKEKLKQIGKYNALGSLGECDSEDDEASEESGEDSEESESEEELEDTAVETTLDLTNKLNIAEDNKIDVNGKVGSVEPTAENFVSLGNNREILAEIKKQPESYLDELLPLIMKVSALSINNQEQVA